MGNWLRFVTKRAREQACPEERLAARRRHGDDEAVAADELIDRDDVVAIFNVLFDIRTELRSIRRILEDQDGEEEETRD
jgi:hypothetical protein